MKVTDRRGKITTYGYDALHRIILSVTALLAADQVRLTRARSPTITTRLVISPVPSIR